MQNGIKLKTITIGIYFIVWRKEEERNEMVGSEIFFKILKVEQSLSSYAAQPSHTHTHTHTHTVTHTHTHTYTQ